MDIKILEHEKRGKHEEIFRSHENSIMQLISDRAIEKGSSGEGAPFAGAKKNVHTIGKHKIFTCE